MAKGISLKAIKIMLYIGIFYGEDYEDYEVYEYRTI